MKALITPGALSAAAFAISAALLALPAQAQAEGSAVSRAAVNAETRAANLAGELMPAGEGSPVDKPIASNKSREQRKAETMQARRNGEFQPGGLGLYKSHMSQHTATANSSKTRAERKAETQQAAKHHQLMRAGEVG